MKTADALIAGKVEEVRSEYEARGFEIVADPGPEHIPFELMGISPDLLACKGDEHYLIVVRASGAWVSMSRMVELADQVRVHHGWHLLLVTADDIDLVGAPGVDDELPGWPSLRAEVSRALAMAQGGADPDAAFFVLWATLEGVLRKTAECQNLPVERLPTADVLPSLYDFGGLTMEQFDHLRSLLALRNRVAHGFGASRDELEAAVRTLAAVLPELLPHPAERAA